MGKHHPGLEIGDFVTWPRSGFHLKWWEALVWGFWHLAEMDIGRCKWQTKTLQNSISQNFTPKAHCAKMHASPNKKSSTHPSIVWNASHRNVLPIFSESQNPKWCSQTSSNPLTSIHGWSHCRLPAWWCGHDTSSSSRQSPPPGSYCLCGGTQGHIFLEWLQDSQSVSHCHQAPSSALAHTCNSFLGISASW